MFNSIDQALDRSLHEMRAAKLILEKSDSHWFGRRIKCFKKGSDWGLISLVALAILGEQKLLASIFGLALFCKSISKENQRENEIKKFFTKARNALLPSPEPIEIKSETRTFNHVFDFAIENGIIWTRRRHCQEEWQPLFFDGYMEERIPQAIDCDGANLIVLDEKNFVHYKKILREFRVKEVKDRNRVRFRALGVDFENDSYIAIDKSRRDNWKEKWFSLPCIHHIVNLFKEKRLQLPIDNRAWAISHRGHYINYLEDHLKRQHLFNVGTTTLYVLDRNGKDILKYDPWSPKFVKISFPVPETSQTSFEAENMSASASVIMIIGYEVQKKSPEKQRLQIYTCLADIDSMGWNPGLKYDYFEHPHDRDVIILPLPSWKMHRLELLEGDFVTRNITILQIGEGNDAREMRIEGQKQGKTGFYFKKIQDENWDFETLERREIDKMEFLPSEKECSADFLTSANNYESLEAKFYEIEIESITAKMENFGQRTFHSKLILKMGRRKYSLDIYRKKTLKNFIGFEGDAYELVVPKEYHQDQLLMKALKYRKIIPLTITEGRSVVIIEDRQENCFTLNFSKTNE